jgi:hypothetical protein
MLAAERSSETEPVEPAPERQPNDLELGWIVVGRLDEPDRAAVRAARQELLAEMREVFPEFHWRMPLIERSDLPTAMREEPVELLQVGLDERDVRHWDYVLVVTGADLVSHRKPYTLGVPSRAMGVGVLSTARIDPQAEGTECDPEERARVMTRRTRALAAQLLGSLGGLDHGDGAMREVKELSDLDQRAPFTADDRDALEAELREVADLRVEEERPQSRRLPFYLRSAWINRDAIGSAIWRAQPWRFPWRLSKLTTAALSTLFVLINTAEVWEVAIGQSPWFLAGLSLTTLAVTSWYVVRRQRLLARRNQRRLTEQIVVTNLSMTVVVVLGMLTTYVGVFALTWLLGATVFPGSVVENWTGTPARLEHYAYLSGFVASLGIVIGALGVSFEQQHYFRHMVYVDDEI